MEIITQLETYINAQKAVGTHFILLGLGLLLVAVLTHFVTSNTPLANGLKIGAIACGLLILIGGFGYRSFSKNLYLSQTAIYEKDKSEFIKSESKRMDNVVKDYPKYQMIAAFFIVIALVIVLFTKSPFWHGLAFAVLIMFGTIMIIEAFSHSSIKQYHTEINLVK